MRSCAPWFLGALFLGVLELLGVVVLGSPSIWSPWGVRTEQTKTWDMMQPKCQGNCNML